jgi:hypothetical protein
MEVRGNNATTFTGEFIANSGSLELRGGNANAFGSTDKGITINGGRLRLRDLGAITINEPVIINGWNSSGSINNTASLGVNLAGAVTLNTSGCFSVTPWNSPIEPGRKMDTVFLRRHLRRRQSPRQPLLAGCWELRQRDRHPEPGPASSSSAPPTPGAVTRTSRRTAQPTAPASSPAPSG